MLLILLASLLVDQYKYYIVIETIVIYEDWLRRLQI